MDGILLIDKPKNWTSFDVVAKTRNIIKSELGEKVKVGHTGTLDPLATGLLVIVVGSYCKRAQEFSKLDKIYDLSIKLGQNSTTGDAEGEIMEISNKQPKKNEFKDTVLSFVGESMQVPPAFSAIKVDGKRAYKLAREGKEVKIEPRKINIYNISDIKYQYPVASFSCKVSSGTYIRSLVQDIGDKLETGGYMSDLRRTQVGQFNLEDSITIDQINIDKIIKI